MPHVTICARCASCYEASSEECANAPPRWSAARSRDRLCRGCYARLHPALHRLVWSLEAAKARIEGRPWERLP